MVVVWVGDLNKLLHCGITANKAYLETWASKKSHRPMLNATQNTLATTC